MYTAGEIAGIVGGEVRGNSSLKVENFLHDSRRVLIPSHSAFLSFTGQAHDGHRYVQDLSKKGVETFIVERFVELEEENSCQIKVADVLGALQELAAHHRGRFDIPVVGITGSNGKTIVKEWAFQLLHTDLNIVRNPRSWNSQVGVPLSVLQIRAEHDVAIFEAGISTNGEMERLQRVIQPTIGVFTNIGDAHASGFDSQQEKIEEKLKLFSDVGKLIYHKQNGVLSEHIEVFGKQNPQVELLSWTFDEVTDAEFHFDKSIFAYRDEAGAENSAHALAICHSLSDHHSKREYALMELTPIDMRLNHRTGVNNCSLICDYYNSDLRSLEVALDWMEMSHGARSKTVVLSDILQSDLKGEQLYAEIGQMLSEHGVDRLIGIGQDISANRAQFEGMSTSFFLSTDEFLAKTSIFEFDGETILLKGARPFRFERIERFLEEQVHSTHLEIDLNAMLQNLNHYRAMLKPSTKLMAMVKALSYGSGGHEVARFLEFNGVDYLAVAYADEGIQLRKDGVSKPIMVMNPEAAAFPSMLEYSLEPEIYSLELLQALTLEAESFGAPSVGIHIELNTGMNRLGFDEVSIPQLREYLANDSTLVVKSVFSHLTSSDMPGHDQYTLEQIQKFDQLYDDLCAGMTPRPLKHIANSAGILRFPGSQYDMVRLGLGLYGIDPSESINDELQVVGTLKCRISQLRRVKAGDPIGYARNSVSEEDRDIAVVAIGYADGLNRLLSCGQGYFLINGAKAPIVGNICMDMTMCDVTGIQCAVGDQVIVFGEDPDIIEMAKMLETIPYEILTSVSHRVKRVFTQE